MTTTRTQPPLPPVRLDHRRHRAASSFSPSSSSSISTASSAASSPSPSPSPRTTSVPFSWEHHPGIPKTKNHSLRGGGGADPTAYSPPTPLPLPPPLRAPPSRRRTSRPPPAGGPAVDPFAAALAECTREHAGVIDMDALFPPAPASAATGAGRAGSRRWSVATGGMVGFLDLYGCKSAMAVAEGAFVVRRPVAAVTRAGPGRAGQGQGRTGRAGRR